MAISGEADAFSMFLASAFLGSAAGYASGLRGFFGERRAQRGKMGPGRA